MTQIQLEGKISTLLLETSVPVQERVPFTVVSCAAAGADFHSFISLQSGRCHL